MRLAGFWPPRYRLGLWVGLEAPDLCRERKGGWLLSRAGWLQASAARIANIRQYITNEYMHSGLRDDGPHIFERLLGMTRGTVPLF